jgi:hypothetical protein
MFEQENDFNGSAVTKFDHPFAKVCRNVLKERYPEKEAAIPADSLLSDNEIPQDVVDEALKRYFVSKRPIIGPRIRIHSTAFDQKPKMARTITYV